MRTLHVVALVLVIIGAINWGLVGLFNFDLVAALFGGEMEPLSRIVYTLVGIAGIIVAATAAPIMRGHPVEHRGHHAAG